MKNLPTLTVLIVLLGIGGFRIASAWQKGDAGSSKETQGQTVIGDAKNHPDAVEVIRQARNRLFERQSVQAEMSEIVTLGNYAFRSGGSYASAPGFRYRLEYQVELGGLRGSFLEVCDGQVLHTRREIGDVKASIASTQAPEIEMSRRDIQRIRREALGIKENKQGEELAEALRVAEIGIGGLPAILASLERSLTFTGLRQEAIEGRDFLVVEGTWKPGRRERLFAGMGAASQQVAGFMPDVVRVYLARESLFPEKFVYLKQEGKEEKSLTPLVTVEFKNVVLDQPVPERLFVYVAPPGVEEKDDTAIFLEAMRQTAEPATEK